MINLIRTATATLLLLAAPAVLLAQSGRRSSKPPTTTPPATTSAPNVETTKPAIAQAAVVKAKLLVAIQHTKKNLPSEDAIYASLVKRLKEFGDVSATAIGELKTDQAVKRAQQEDEVYVAVVQFEIDVVQKGHLVLNSQNLQITCYVYAPKTGERKVKDKTYYQPLGGIGSRTSGSPGGTPVKITPEAAGISVAEQIRSGLLLVLGTQSPSLKLP